MGEERYDIIVVGAGVGGLAAGALLAARAGYRVLILEQAPQVGGRAISFTWPASFRESSAFRMTMGSAARARFTGSFPSLDDLFNSSLLSGYTLDTGIHVSTLADRGRLPYLLASLGRSVPFGANEDAHLFYGERFHSLSQGCDFLPAEDQKDIKKISREMLSMSMSEIAEYDNVAFSNYLGARTVCRGALDLHGTIASISTTLSDGRLISAGDAIKMNRSARQAGARINFKSAGYINDQQGFQMIPNVLAEVFCAGNGNIVTNARVREIIIERGAVRGVRAEVQGRLQMFRAPVVISNLPIQSTFSIVSESHFPADWVMRVKAFWASGGITTYVALKEPVFFGKSQYLVPSLKGFSDRLDYDVRFVIWPLSDWAPAIAPPGKQLVALFTILNRGHVYDPVLSRKAVDQALAFSSHYFSGFEEKIEWWMAWASDQVCAVAQAPGQVGKSRPSVAAPGIEGLFFTGETVGAWGAVTDCAVDGAVRCAGAVSGKDFFEGFPSYYRE